MANIIEFPERIVYPLDFPHRVDGGGSPMQIKHTHPQYPTIETRERALQDAHRAALAAVRKLRGKQQKLIPMRQECSA